MKGEEPGIVFRLFEKLVFKTVKEKLGLDQAVELLSGAAPLQKKTREFFFSMNMFINNIFGMSETSGPMTGILPQDYAKYDLDSAGLAIPGSEVIVVRQDEKTGTGELCFRGRNVFMGYLKNEIATREAIDSQGRVHSGDEGKLDQRGVMSITGRFKELLVTAGGENVAPVPIELDIKSELPFLSNVTLIGDHMKFVSAIITFKVTSTPLALPNHDLLPEAIEQLENKGIKKVKTVEQAIANEKVKKLIQKGIDAVNKRVVSNAAKVKSWFAVPDDFSVAGGELTPTMKVKRKVVTTKYSEQISKLYSNPGM